MMTTMKCPRDIQDRLKARKIHKNQALYEVIEKLLDAENKEDLL